MPKSKRKNEDMPTRDTSSTVHMFTPGNLKRHIPPFTIGICTHLQLVGWVQCGIRTSNWSNWNKKTSNGIKGTL